MKRIKYTPQQLDFLRTGYLSMNIRSLTSAFNAEFGLAKTETAIKNTLNNHGIKCGRKIKDRLWSGSRLYTDEQLQFIRDNYTGRSVEELKDLFNNRFGTSMTWQQIKSAVSNRGIISGRTGCFEKGHAPWNEGTKGQGLTTANKRSFKKGNAPKNRKPLGHERIDPRYGYVLIKVAEKNPNTGFPTRYKHKHVHIWELENGPVPEGMVVAFKNGDPACCEIDNLMLISRAELLNLNHHGYKEIPAELKPSVLALVKLQSKTGEKKKILKKRGDNHAA